MAADSSIWYSMDKTEFYVILAALGVREWYGFGVSDAEMPGSCEDINRLLADLYQNEVISFDDEKLVLNKGYSEAFDVLKSAEKCVCAMGGRENGTTVLSYGSGGHMVMTEQDDTDSALMRFTVTSASAWPRMILRETMDLERITRGQVRVADEEVRTLTGRDMTAAEAALLPDVLAVYDMIDIHDGRTEERLTIREKGLLQYMVHDRAGSEEIAVMEGGLAEAGRFLNNWKERADK